MGASPETLERLRAKIRDIPDFPKPGVLFKDITPLLADREAFRSAIDLIGERYADRQIDAVVGIEARGFLLGAAVAYRIGAGNAIVRKAGKLPYRTIRALYQLEYGTDALEIHEDAILPGQRVLIVDDVLATGGTMKAVIDLVKQLGGKVEGLAFLIELGFLKGREKLPGADIYSLLVY